MTDEFKYPAPKKRKSPLAKVGATAARTVDLKAKAFEMLLTGKRCPEIGEALGVSRVTAWKYCKEQLSILKEETLEDASDWRTFITEQHLENLAYGRTLRNGNPSAPADSDARYGDPKGADIVDKALSQLKSLYIPALPTSVKTELSGPNGGPLQVQAGAPDLTKLSDAQLAQLESILTSVIPAPDEPLQGL